MFLTHDLYLPFKYHAHQIITTYKVGITVVLILTYERTYLRTSIKIVHGFQTRPGFFNIRVSVIAGFYIPRESGAVVALRIVASRKISSHWLLTLLGGRHEADKSHR